MKCRLCGKNPATDGNCLTRVNPLGETPNSAAKLKG